MAEIVGGTATSEVSWGKRLLASIFDLFILPVVIGIVFGLIVANAPDPVKITVLVIVGILNLIWLLIRDAVWSPGRLMAGIRLVSETGGEVGLSQAFLRNLLLIAPPLVALVISLVAPAAAAFTWIIGYIGYGIETFSLIFKGARLGDGWARTKTVTK